MAQQSVRDGNELHPLALVSPDQDGEVRLQNAARLCLGQRLGGCGGACEGEPEKNQ